nr:histidine kinase [Nocardia abscessus]
MRTTCETALRRHHHHHRSSVARTTTAGRRAPRRPRQDLPRRRARLVLPMQTCDSTVGVLVALRAAESAPYNDETLELTTAFTGQAALAMRLADAQRRMRELDILSDRDRIARDLHDHVIQHLFAVGLSLPNDVTPSGLKNLVRRAEDAGGTFTITAGNGPDESPVGTRLH